MLVDGHATPFAAPNAASDDELVELRFEVIGRDGRPGLAHINVFDVDDAAVSAYRRLPGDPDAECTATAVVAGALHPGAAGHLLPDGAGQDDARRPAERPGPVHDPEPLPRRRPRGRGDRGPHVHVRRPARPSDRGADARRPHQHERQRRDGARLLPHRGQRAVDQGVAAAGQPARPELLHGAHRHCADRRAADADPDPAGGAGHRARRRRAPTTCTRTYFDASWFSDFSSQFPVYDGRDRLRVVDAGHATADDLAGRDLRGALAVVERSAAYSVAEQSNRAAAAGAVLVAVYNDAPGDDGDPNGTGTMLEVPTMRLSRAEGRDLLDLRRNDRVEVRGEAVTPYVYDMVLKEKGRIRPDLTYTARRGRNGNLSEQVREFHGQPSIGSTFTEAAYPWQPGDTIASSRTFPLRGGAADPHGVPARRPRHPLEVLLHRAGVEVQLLLPARPGAGDAADRRPGSAPTRPASERKTGRCRTGHRERPTRRRRSSGPATGCASSSSGLPRRRGQLRHLAHRRQRDEHAAGDPCR